MSERTITTDAGAETATQAADRPRPIGLLVVLLLLIGAAAAVGSQLSGATQADAELSKWFARQRTPILDDVTAVFSAMASTFIVVMTGTTVIVVCLLRRVREGLLILIVGMAGEIVMFLTITLIVDRPRPTVPHLDPAPPTSSFPSGHTLATFVLWNAIAIVAVRQQWRPTLSHLAKLLAVVMPLAVGVSRVYRGMHHPTDVVASLVIGVIWTTSVVVWFSPTAVGQWLARPQHQRSS